MTTIGQEYDEKLEELQQEGVADSDLYDLSELNNAGNSHKQVGRGLATAVYGIEVLDQAYDHIEDPSLQDEIEDLQTWAEQHDYVLETTEGKQIDTEKLEEDLLNMAYDGHRDVNEEMIRMCQQIGDVINRTEAATFQFFENMAYSEDSPTETTSTPQTGPDPFEDEENVTDNQDYDGEDDEDGLGSLFGDEEPSDTTDEGFSDDEEDYDDPFADDFNGSPTDTEDDILESDDDPAGTDDGFDSLEPETEPTDTEPGNTWDSDDDYSEDDFTGTSDTEDDGFSDESDTADTFDPSSEDDSSWREDPDPDPTTTTDPGTDRGDSDDTTDDTDPTGFDPDGDEELTYDDLTVIEKIPYKIGDTFLDLFGGDR